MLFSRLEMKNFHFPFNFQWNFSQSSITLHIPNQLFSSKIDEELYSVGIVIKSFGDFNYDYNYDYNLCSGRN